ncbi:hypothetical protein NDU88_005221 [Pleurodeles waltl]|uniref:Nascent polypeptide-associated complex subunit alpha-like UBA domain-containing protein n=1 Tax=Pleurodeles waltl TaxID=8319 RepID=A0AAV7QFD3_PLEWA|nr:hypothetical protein NDU88_005221 [Pleurodeles waltl]
MFAIGDRRPREQKAKQKREKELAKVTIKKTDVELIMNEMEIPRATAERSLREHMWNVVEALIALTNCIIWLCLEQPGGLQSPFFLAAGSVFPIFKALLALKTSVLSHREQPGGLRAPSFLAAGTTLPAPAVCLAPCPEGRHIIRSRLGQEWGYLRQSVPGKSYLFKLQRYCVVG